MNKADTLENLRAKVKTAVILPQYAFTVDEWQKKNTAVLEAIQKQFSNKTLIVRSSALGEDGVFSSMAGAYRSVSNVESRNQFALMEAIHQVVDSFESLEGQNKIFVQEWIHPVIMSGVVLSRDLESLAPYYIVNYDDQSQKTDTVTSGDGKALKTCYISRFEIPASINKNIAKILASLREVEGHLDCESLDVEFAFDVNGTLYLFQARSLVFLQKPSKTEDEGLKEHLCQIYAKIGELQKPHPYLYGRCSVFGIMPDWNPAEMIGVRPRRLALSLYKELITDNIWAYQRDNYGYRNLRSFPLMVSFAGLPYIDVRTSFNSFVPAHLQEDIARHLVDYYIERLVAMPESHDKVEFDVVFSCYTLDLDERLEALTGEFTRWELGDLRSSLRDITNRIIDPVTGLYRQDLNKIGLLEQKRKKIMESDLSPIAKIYWLLEDCKRYGTLPFAGLARAGFIAVQMLHSFVSSGVLTKQELEAYLASLNTVAKSMNRDVVKVRQGVLSLEKFLSDYGHLRPGTYDILSQRYDEAPERYFGLQDSYMDSPDTPSNVFSFSAGQKEQLEKGLKKHGLAVEADALLQFIHEAIEGREYAKFLFSKNLSDSLQCIGALGKDLGFSLEDLSHLDVATLMKLYAGTAWPDPVSFLAQDMEEGKKFFEVTRRLKLPPLICKQEDIYCFEIKEGTPNFITLARVTAETAVGETISRQTVKGKIVLVECADPGYDWIFSHQIAGLITMYGGANSHMAIRAAELKIPAVIGCGEKLFSLWSCARKLEIDTANRKVFILQ